LRAIAEGTAGAVGEELLRGLVRTVADAFGARLVFVGRRTARTCASSRADTTPRSWRNRVASPVGAGTDVTTLIPPGAG